MRYFLFILIILVLFPNQILGQREIHPSIHKIQYQRHYDVPSLYMPTPSVPIQPLQKRMVVPERTVFGYLPYWSSSQYLRWSHLSTLAYFGLEFDGQGNIIKRRGWPPTSLINQAHQQGVKVVVVAINFNPNEIHALITNSSNRDHFINNVIAEIKKGNADGVNIDFELPDSDDRNALTNFMSLLTQRCHSEVPGSHVSIATPAVDWIGAFDYNNLAKVCDGLMIMAYNYWWNGSSTAGPVSPLEGSTYNVTRTVNEYLNQTQYNRKKLILGVPYYGIEWKTENDRSGASTLGYGDSQTFQEAARNAKRYGRRWSDQYKTPWYAYQSAGDWFQCWYEDSLSLSYTYELTLQKQLAGIGIWALGYDGSRPELWGAIQDHFISDAGVLPPTFPTHFFVESIGNFRLFITFHRSENAEGYQLFTSGDAIHFDSGADCPDTNQIVLHMPHNMPFYFKLRAVNEAGTSSFTELLSGVSASRQANTLIVNGFDRISGTINTFDFIRQHADALYENDNMYSSASNEAVISGDVQLSNYRLVIWILGEEGTSTESFSQEEQQIIQDYLQSGGSLFVSGSEVGYDLVAEGTDQDAAFYRNYLKADYITDDTQSHAFQGVDNSDFSDIPAIAFEDGSHGGYDVNYPDGIKPHEGSQLGFVYNGVDYQTRGGAGIYYHGPFGESEQFGKLVYLGFPFEMIVAQEERQLLMEKILDFFSTPEDTVASIPAESFELQTYPNPLYLPVNHIVYLTLKSGLDYPVEIQLYNSLGQQIKNVYTGTIPDSPLEVDISSMSAGVYFIMATCRELVERKKIVILR